MNLNSQKNMEPGKKYKVYYMSNGSKVHVHYGKEKEYSYRNARQIVRLMRLAEKCCFIEPV